MDNINLKEITDLSVGDLISVDKIKLENFKKVYISIKDTYTDKVLGSSYFYYCVYDLHIIDLESKKDIKNLTLILAHNLRTLKKFNNAFFYFYAIDCYCNIIDNENLSEFIEKVPTELLKFIRSLGHMLLDLTCKGLLETESDYHSYIISNNFFNNVKNKKAKEYIKNNLEPILNILIDIFKTSRIQEFGETFYI